MKIVSRRYSKLNRAHLYRCTGCWKGFNDFYNGSTCREKKFNSSYPWNQSFRKWINFIIDEETISWVFDIIIYWKYWIDIRFQESKRDYLIDVIIDVNKVNMIGKKKYLWRDTNNKQMWIENIHFPYSIRFLLILINISDKYVDITFFWINLSLYSMCCEVTHPWWSNHQR